MSSKLTPMMRQYRRVKDQIPPGTLLLFRLGDFYEMFFDDARAASGALDIALTQRNGIPMCGVPYHAVESYVARLVRAGFKVALCDQVEDASKARGIVRRELTQVITAGTATSESLLQPGRNNYLMACCPGGRRYGLAFLDLSTGEFRACELDDLEAARSEVARWQPTECLVPEETATADPAFAEALRWGGDAVVTQIADDLFAEDGAALRLTEHFQTDRLDGFGLGSMSAAVGACGAVLAYVGEVLHGNAAHIRSLGVYDTGEYVGIDADTQRNLDLVEDARTGRRDGSLLGVLDATVTPMGSRSLRSWILRPLRRVAAIRERQDVVRWFADHAASRDALRAALAEVRDLERTASRVSLGHGGPRDVAAIASAIFAGPRVRAAVADGGDALATAVEAVPERSAIAERIRNALVDTPPALVRDGGIFRDGYHSELDELREAATGGRRWIARYQADEQERTGIKSLKVRYNKVFGYYIEVTRANLGAVPPEYHRKQTLANAERFITDELKTYETRIVGAEERTRELEAELFAQLRAEVAAELSPILAAARAFARLDVLSALAHVGVHEGYHLPEVDDDDRIEIRDGRHPVIERTLEGERFVPNDALLTGSEHQVLIITGPNMAGKSTYIRQVALLVLMAQIGSMIPARSARIGVADRIFTRVGASDDLSRGRSTFMVEMHEAANILNNATSRSLVILDEIGRGTSTFDGISIAWAVAEYLHDEPGRNARTLFATHYHELTDLARSMTGVRNYSIAVEESGERIVFLRKIVEGPTDRSYGIQVARLAGLPPRVIDRAREILTTLEEGEFTDSGQPRLAQRRRRRVLDDDSQLRFFG